MNCRPFRVVAQLVVAGNASSDTFAQPSGSPNPARNRKRRITKTPHPWRSWI